MQKDKLADANIQFLVELGIEHSIFIPTETALKKSIIDATAPVREHFSYEKFHDYSSQGQGKSNKVTKGAFLVKPENIVTSDIRLYRPSTKKGDPRMWVPKLADFLTANERIACIIINDSLYLFNLHAYDLRYYYTLDGNYISKTIKKKKALATAISNELLIKLRIIAQKPLEAIKKGDTSIGMSIEKALGIKANSSKEPDYKGIEIKSYRSARNRTTLFTQVANWQLSRLKSSKEIIESYGYEREGIRKLNCTVNAIKPNSQGLMFKYAEDQGLLNEIHDIDGDVVAWKKLTLKQRLLEKHAETFWIKADAFYSGEVEFFNLKSVIHTKSPVSSRFIPLIESGQITMDHMIKKSANGKVSERGPSFKMKKEDLPLLFPEPKEYRLI